MKAQRRFTEHAPMAPAGVLALDPAHQAASDGRTLFPTTVVSAMDSPRLLVSGANQRKLGDRVVKGAWAGFPIYSLTLEERATCPRSCRRWLDCMGNGMHLARRHRPGLDLENLLWVELDALAALHPGGFVVRLHVLGDFYAVRYAELWAAALLTIPALHLFGYTARNPAMGIGHLVAGMNERFPDRCAIRFSTATPGPMRAVTIGRIPEGRRVPEGIVCPAQTGATECCGTCGLCWAEAAKGQSIVFVLHGRKPRGRRPAIGGLVGEAGSPKKAAKPTLVVVNEEPPALPATASSENKPRHDGGQQDHEHGAADPAGQRAGGAAADFVAGRVEDAAALPRERQEDIGAKALAPDLRQRAEAPEGQGNARPESEHHGKDPGQQIGQAVADHSPEIHHAPRSRSTNGMRDHSQSTDAVNAESEQRAEARLGAEILEKTVVLDRGRKEPRGCRWITGDVRSGDWSYCQRPATGPYCPEHTAKAGGFYTGTGRRK